MKLLFAYFDFSEWDNSRTLGEFSLNFSTTHNYSVKKTIVSSTKYPTHTYTLSCCEKPENECIPDGFWGDRIFNVTAIVGINGSGKSTIIHNMIKALVHGLKPDVPFLLVLQKTDSDDLCLYCSEPEFRWEGAGTLQCEYPDELKRTKTMLLDNTLSFSSITLDGLYESVYSPNRRFDRAIMPDPIYENIKQFYNKSLAASIRFSNSMSMAGRDMQYIPVSEMLASHFRYETYQETRFLFDRFQQENLSSLNDENFSVPKPSYLFVSIYPFGDLLRIASTHNYYLDERGTESGPGVCKILQSCGFIGEILADVVLNLYVIFIGTFKKEIIDSIYNVSEMPLQLNESVDLSEKALLLADEVLKGFDHYTNSESQYSSRTQKIIENNKCFVSFLFDNRQTLLEIFEPVDYKYQYSITGEYQIDVEKTVSKEEKRNCIISFLDLYRSISEPTYFLVFTSGMSSGEKNLLRMLTQLRYALDGPSVYSVNATKNNTDNSLKNEFPDQRKEVCDTLFLFLDEADLTYHPEWQRIFISKLTAILPRIFRDPYNEKGDNTSGCKDIQIIITTHSPIMLGDFPKPCVNYLKDNHQSEMEINQIQQQSIFGENLYTILKNSFFMKEALGEFASNKIKGVVKWCSDIRGRINKSKSDVNEEDKNGQTICDEIQRAVCWNNYSTVNLLPQGIIRSKLIAEMRECTEKCSLKCSGECVIKIDRDPSREMERRIKELEKRNNELGRQLNQANEKLQKAGLLNEQNS